MQRKIFKKSWKLFIEEIIVAVVQEWCIRRLQPKSGKNSGAIARLKFIFLNLFFRMPVKNMWPISGLDRKSYWFELSQYYFLVCAEFCEYTDHNQYTNAFLSAWIIESPSANFYHFPNHIFPVPATAKARRWGFYSKARLNNKLHKML
jgi:hypothetical protein